MKILIKTLTSDRFKSFYWRISMMLLAVLLSSISENIGMLELSPQATVVLGLIFGEWSKALNNGYKEKQAEKKEFSY